MPASSAGNIPLPRSLRANRNPHPGIADAPRPKRTKEEVQAEKAAKASKIASRETSRSDTIEETAILEVKMRQDHELRLKTASNPPLTTLTKQSRPKAAPAVNAEMGNGFSDFFGFFQDNKLT